MSNGREAHYRAVLYTIAHADRLTWLQRNCEKRYGLSYFEALEMAYENLIDEAKEGLKKPVQKPAEAP